MKLNLTKLDLDRPIPNLIHTSFFYSMKKMGTCFPKPVRLAYQPPASSTFLSEQTSHQQPGSSTFLSEQTSTSHQPPAKRTG
jgi:hypothetical protein